MSDEIIIEQYNMWVVCKSNPKNMWIILLCKTYINVKIDFDNLITQWITQFYDKYSNDPHYIDTHFINVAYMKFTNMCVHSIKNYLRKP